MTVDVHTIVKEQRETEPSLSHFLLLIVAGELRGVQRIPLEPGADRLAEEGESEQVLATNPLSLGQKNHSPLRVVAERAVVAHICQELLLEHKNLTADMPRMQVTAIGQRIPLSGVEHVAGRNPDILGFAWLQHNLCLHHGRSPSIRRVGHLKTMVSSGIVRHLEQDRTTRPNFEIDDRDGWIPRL